MLTTLVYSVTYSFIKEYSTTEYSTTEYSTTEYSTTEYFDTIKIIK